MDNPSSNPSEVYRIRIKGIPDQSLVDWLGELQVFPQEHGETLLVGKFPDQPALRGLVDQLWNLNFTVLEVERLEDNDKR